MIPDTNKLKLLSYGKIITSGNNTETAIATTVNCAFSNNNAFKNKTETIHNYYANIIEYKDGTFWVNPNMGVKFIKITEIVSGLGQAGLLGIRWRNANAKTLPTGVTYNAGEYILPAGATYTGSVLNAEMAIDESNTEGFYIDPQFSPNGGSFYPSRGGTQSSLEIECYG